MTSNTGKKSNPQQLSGTTGDVTLHKIGPFTVWGLVYTGIMISGTPSADRTASFNCNMGNDGSQFFFTNSAQWQTFSSTDALGNFGMIIFQGFDPLTKELSYAYMETVVGTTPPTSMPGWTIGTITLDDPIVLEQSNSER